MKREQVLEILRTELSKAFEMGLKQSPFDAENSEFYRPMIDLTIAPRVTDEIMALPLDVPSDEEIEQIIRDYYNSGFLQLTDMVIYDRVKGGKLIRDEIIKRNVK